MALRPAFFSQRFSRVFSLFAFAGLVVSACGMARATLATNPYFSEDFNYTVGSSLVGKTNPRGVWQGSAGSQIAVDAGPCMKMTGGVGSFDAYQVTSYTGTGGIIWVHFKARTGSGGSATMWSLWLDDTAGASLARFYGSANTCRGRIGGTSTVTNPFTLVAGVWNDLDIKINTTANTCEFFLNGASMGVLNHGTGPNNTLGLIRFERVDYNLATDHVILFDEPRVGDGAWNPTIPPTAPSVTSPADGSVASDVAVPIVWQGDLHDAYEVHVNTTNTPADANGWDSGVVSSAADTCTTGDLADNTTYYVFVRLHNPIGWGPWSAAGRDFTVNIVGDPPAAPRLVTPTDGANVTLQKPVIRWIGDDHDRYEVHINTTNSANDADGWDSGQVAGSDDWCDSGTLANGTYYVFARLHKPAGWGPWSSGRQFQIDFTGAVTKKGWIFIRYDMPYHLDLLTKAREYHVNQLHISHDIMMYAWEPINDVNRRNDINQLIDTAHANGISEVVLWVHDIQFTNMPGQYLVGGKVNLDDPGFWSWMDSQYETLFDVCPNADGLIFTFSENFTGADFDDRMATIHTGKTPEDSLAQAIETLWNVCSRNNKSLYIRTWGNERWIRNALLRNDPRIWMMSKATGAGDWNVIQEDFDIIGTATGHPELEEFDFTGEYWGLTYTPWAGIDYMKHLWTDFGLPRGVDGMAARIDRDNGMAVRTPNRINMFALDALADYPDLSSDEIYEYWSKHWFGTTAGPKVASALKRSFDITNCSYSLPLIYPFSGMVARNYVPRSIFDLDCVSAILKGSSDFQAGSTDYDLFHGRFMNAAGRLGISVPSTLFGDFSPAYSAETTPTCSVTIVDAATGLNPALFKVELSTDGGATWINHASFIVMGEGTATDPYHITANTVFFGARRAARNKVRFSATNLLGQVSSQVFTVRGLDNGYVTLGSSIVSDGITHPQGGDGDTYATTAGGRSCRTTDTSDVNFYFQTDEGFAHDRSPGTIWLQVDYYGSSGSITPYYDSIWRNDEPLPPVYLNGGTTWRTATWSLDDVNFGRRIGSQAADFRLYVGSASATIFISQVRLSYAPPAGMLSQPANLSVSALSGNRAWLAWDAAAGATKYQVCRGGVSIGWPTVPSFTDSGLVPNTQYGYTVTAFDNSGNTSCASTMEYKTSLSVPPSGTTVTSVPAAATWQSSSLVNFTPVGGFGPGKAAYYQYAWDESPTHVWTGSEPTWPAVGPPSGGGWTVWNATSSPVDLSPWLMYEGSATQRGVSEELIVENGIPAWLYVDQGRVSNTKAKIALWPILTINRNTGVTMTVRMKAAPSPMGWYNNGKNFGLHLPDCQETGVVVRPDSLQLKGPTANGAVEAVDNGYTYHTYTLTLKNATAGNNSTARYNLYRDGALLSGITQGPSGSGFWSGPFFGHTTSDALGAWAWEWIAWNTTGAYAPSPGTGVLTTTAAHHGSGYYLHLRGFNSDGVPSGTVDLGPYYYWNGSTPVNPTVVDDGAYTTAEAIHAKWSPVGPSPTFYEYAIGTAPNLGNVAGYTNVGLSTEVTRTGLSLIGGQTYYVTVRGTVGAGTYTGTSDGITVAPDRDKVAGAKIAADGAASALYGKTVTAVLPDRGYVQDLKGMGIRVVTSRPMAVGDVVDLAGTMAGSDVEKLLAADTVIVKGAGSIGPLSMPARSIGGAAFVYNPVTKTGQQGVTGYSGGLPKDAIGLNTVGALVRVTGKVTWTGADTFYIDDGSRYDDYQTIGANSPIGIKVSVPAGVAPPALDSFAVVTAIGSVYQSDDGLRRLLLVRGQGDIQTF
ncbi:MAG: hypothetical protein Q7T82_02170 [Armatimonadota bacterium]|nr:hypothetical protein [Armatimonadota bacterium]